MKLVEIFNEIRIQPELPKFQYNDNLANWYPSIARITNEKGLETFIEINEYDLENDNINLDEVRLVWKQYQTEMWAYNNGNLTDLNQFKKFNTVGMLWRSEDDPYIIFY